MLSYFIDVDIRWVNSYCLPYVKNMEQTMTTDEAIRHYGSKAKLAAALGIWPHGIYRWGESPPILRQYQIEKLTRRELVADDDL